MVILQIIFALTLWGVAHWIVFRIWYDFGYDDCIDDIPVAIITVFPLWIDYLLITTRIQITL